MAAGRWRGRGAVGRKNSLNFFLQVYGAAPSINDMKNLAAVTAGAQQAQLQTNQFGAQVWMPSQAQMQDTVNRQAAAIRRTQTCDIRAIGEYDDEGRAEKLELTFFFIILAPWIAVMAVPVLLTVAVVFGFNALNNMHKCDYTNDAEVKTEAAWADYDIVAILRLPLRLHLRNYAA